MLSTALRVAVAAAATLAASTAFAGVNLISDGDFSNPNQGGGYTIYSPGINGWTSTIGDGVEIGYSPLYGLPTENAGGQNLELNANTYGTDSYTVSGLKVGATYDLSWDYGGRTSGGPSSATVSFGGVVLANDTDSIGTWTYNWFQVVATSTTEDLVLTAAATGAPSYGNEFTNFSLSAVPEPSTWAMMGLGFAGLAFAGYRARRTAISIA
jgi:PEP-CTERM motif